MDYFENLYKSLTKINLPKGEKNYISNLLKCYKLLIKEKFVKKKEIFYLNKWIQDYNNCTIN